MNLIIDENLPPRWCDYLAPFGITAIHWKDIGHIGDPDEIIIDYACGNNAVRHSSIGNADKQGYCIGSSFTDHLCRRFLLHRNTEVSSLPPPIPNA